jgi:hypothetical protein
MDIWIKIRSMFDSAGTKEAAASVAQVGAAGKSAEVGIKAGGAAAVQAGTGFQAASAAAAAGSGSIQGVTSAMAQLLPKFAALQAALPVIGLAVAAFMAWKRVYDLLAESAEKAAASIRETQSDNFAAGAESMAESYGKLSAEIERAAAAQDTLLAHEQNLAAAAYERDKAALTLEKSKAMQNAGSDEERKRIEANFAMRGADVDLAYSAGNVARQNEAFAAKESAAAIREAAAIEQRDKLYAKMSAGQTLYSSIADKMATPPTRQFNAEGEFLFNKIIDRMGEAKRVQGLEGELGKVAGDVAKVGKQLRAADTEVTDARLARADVARQREVAMYATVASNMRGQAAAIDAGSGVLATLPPEQQAEFAAQKAKYADLAARKKKMEAMAAANEGVVAAAMDGMVGELDASMKRMADMLERKFGAVVQTVTDATARIASFPTQQ